MAQKEKKDVEEKEGWWEGTCKPLLALAAFAAMVYHGLTTED